MTCRNTWLVGEIEVSHYNEHNRFCCTLAFDAYLSSNRFGIWYKGVDCWHHRVSRVPATADRLMHIWLLYHKIRITNVSIMQLDFLETSTPPQCRMSEYLSIIEYEVEQLEANPG